MMEGNGDSDVGVRLRVKHIEESQERLETKVDRLQWSIVVAALGYLISIWTGLGGGPA